MLQNKNILLALSSIIFLLSIQVPLYSSEKKVFNDSYFSINQLLHNNSDAPAKLLNEVHHPKSYYADIMYDLKNEWEKSNNKKASKYQTIDELYNKINDNLDTHKMDDKLSSNLVNILNPENNNAEKMTKLTDNAIQLASLTYTEDRINCETIWKNPIFKKDDQGGLCKILAYTFIGMNLLKKE
jgi:hypothetical protein